MIQVFEIEGRLAGFNEYQNACRSHWAKGYQMKRENQDIVCWAIRKAHLKPHKGPVEIHYTFFEQPKRGKLRDKSNISSLAIKVIEDALQEMKIISNDNWNVVRGDSRLYFRVTDNPRILVEIEDV